MLDVYTYTGLELKDEKRLASNGNKNNGIILRSGNTELVKMGKKG